MMHYWYYAGPFSGMAAGAMVLWWFLVIMAIVVLVRWALWNGSGTRHHGHHWGSNSALDVLRERFAKGEIDKKEYEERKKILEEE